MCSIMLNCKEHVTTSIKICGQTIEEVSTFQHLGCIICGYGSSSNRLKQDSRWPREPWQDLISRWKSNAGFPIKIKLYNSLVYSFLYIGVKVGLLQQRDRTEDPGF